MRRLYTAILLLVVAVAMAQAAARYSITVVPGEHGSVASDVTQAEAGTVVTITVTPDVDYELGALLVEERVTTGSLDDDDAWEPARAPRRAAVATTDAGGGVFTFVMPAVGVKVSAIFLHVPFEVECVYGEHSAPVATPGQARPGETVTLTAPEVEGYTFSHYVALFGDTEIAVEDGRFVMPEGPVTVEAIYVPRSYHVLAQVSSHGTVTAEAAMMPTGETVVLTVVPNEGFVVNEVTVERVKVVDGELDDDDDAWEPARVPARAQSVVAVTCHDWCTYSFVMPPSHVRVTATFTAGPITGVDDALTDLPAEQARYNVNGQRVGRDYRGVVIEGGRKRLNRP